MSKERWMIEQVGVGARDVGLPVLWFTVSDGECSAALQVIRSDDLRFTELLSAVYDVRDLNGRMCIVERKDALGGSVSFVRLLQKARA